ncbi:hypothetical protein L249_3242, partial [Ophiocordyceps polyrhachis-furcata BCC 54312]
MLTRGVNTAHRSIISPPLTIHHRAPATADGSVLVLRAAVAAQHRCSAAQSRGEQASRPRHKSVSQPTLVGVRIEGDETDNPYIILPSYLGTGLPTFLRPGSRRHCTKLPSERPTSPGRGGPGPAGALTRPSSDQPYASRMPAAFHVTAALGPSCADFGLRPGRLIVSGAGVFVPDAISLLQPWPLILAGDLSLPPQF